jgi:MerR family transcriptional regulator, thiopeptide resistance regulator
MVYHPDMTYTVKQLATLAGVSVRTLHYYDQIGLLNPESVGDNGYRYYGEAALLRLQQILFYRELDLRLEQIKQIVVSPDFDILSALRAHRKGLAGRAERLERLIQTVDDTIMHLKGAQTMSNKQLFEAFSDEQQEQYAREAEQKYDPEIVRASNRKWKSYSEKDKKRIAEEGNAAYMAILAAMPEGAASPAAQEGVELWRRHMDFFWTPDLDQLLGLAEMYGTDPRFKANFDKINPHLAEFMLEAVSAYVKNHK